MKEVVSVRAWRRWQDWLDLVAGVWLFISPWVLGFAGNGRAGWNAWIIGAVIFLLALGALGNPATPGPEWGNVILGVWLFISPWVLRYTSTDAGSWNAWVVGVIVVAASLWGASLRRPADRLQLQ
jgi:SPW repeat